MIRIIRPSPSRLDDLQRHEQAFYWSACAELFFRKHGLPLAAPGDPDAAAALPVLLRGAASDDDAPCPVVHEGPVDAGVLGRLGLRAKTWKTDLIEVTDGPGRSLGRLTYSTFLTRRIPSSTRETSLPRRFTDPDPRWRARPLRIQFFETGGDRWTPVLFARVGAELRPIAMSDGATIVLGVPLFDLIGFTHAMPALEDGFFRPVRTWPLLALERWLRDRILECARNRGTPLAPVPDWPRGPRGCLTVRHDYDREISTAHLREVLALYDRLGVKATWFLLDGKPPPKGQAAMMADAGHEIALHTISPTFDAMKAETGRFRKRYGQAPRGYTCHGGIGSRGHLALNHNRWALRLGMAYGEFIGRCRGFPHPLVDPAAGWPELRPLMLQDCHHSLDLTMKPEGHQLDFLGRDVPRCLDRGEHVIVMNHPDIHWDELRRLLEALDTTDVWCATLEDAAAWTARAKYGDLFTGATRAVPSAS